MTEKEVLDGMVFMTIAGSHAYGTNVEDSDVDYRGVTLPLDKRLYYGLSRRNFEQKDKWESGEDKCVYDFRKAIDLIAAGNPNMVDLAFTPDTSWRYISRPWFEVIGHREIFLSKKMRHTFSGYAFAQLKRIKGHRNYLLHPPKKKPERSDFGLPDRKPISNDDLQAFLWFVTTLLRNTLAMTMLSDATKEELAAVNLMGLVQGKFGELDEVGAQWVVKNTQMPDNFVDYCMREKRYMSACQGWEAYQNWKTQRNPKRAALEAKFGYDAKHAMHLVRLLRMGMEILEKGEVIVHRPDREELLEIRNGAWEYEKLEAYADECDARMSELYKSSNLPKEPDINRIEALCTSIVEKRLNEF